MWHIAPLPLQLHVVRGMYSIIPLPYPCHTPVIPLSYPCHSSPYLHHTLVKPLSYPYSHVGGCILQALKAASEQPAATPMLTHPQTSAPQLLPEDHLLTPSTANQPSSEQQAIMALTGNSKAATSAADVAAAGTANGKSQNEQVSQAAAITQNSLLGLASDQQQQMQTSAEAGVAVAEAAAVSRQLSHDFADEVSEPESVLEGMDSALESIEVVSL